MTTEVFSIFLELEKALYLVLQRVPKLFILLIVLQHFLTYTVAMILCKTGFHQFRRHLSTIARTSSVFYLQFPTNLANK
ncbi:hypothetical protein YC2023_015324 [Brassica napus]